MKRIYGRPSAQSFPAVSLYLDDIELILEEFRQVGFEPRLRDNEYEFADLGELIKVRGVSPSRLKMDTPALMSSVNLEIARWSTHGVWLSAPSRDAKDQQVASRIRDVLERRRRWTTRLLILQFWWGMSALLFVVGVVGSLPRFGKNQLLLPTLLLPAVGITCLSMFVSSGFLSRINLAHKHATTTLWSRNREKVLVGTIGAVIGAAATELVHRLLAASP